MKQQKIFEWKIRSKHIEFKKRLKGAITIINKAKNLGIKFAISWSGGKDSTAMVHLIKSVWPECPIIVQFDDCDWPEKKPYIYRVIKKMNWKIYEAIPDFSVKQAIFNCDIGNEDICSKTHKLTKYGFLKPLDDIQKILECEGAFLGLRKLESKRRGRNYKYNGNLYRLKSGEYICTPVVHFDAVDIFAYLVSNDIEINPCYFNNAFKTPEKIRLAWAIPSIYGIGQGDIEHIRKYYPKYFNELRERGLA